MALKRWAVRQISGLLSDYLEGITEQNLQASLSLEVGEIEIRHVRLQPGLLAERYLELLSSDVSVSARIPWRNLGSEPTVITVRDVWAEVHAASPSARPKTPAEEEEALRRWRAGRRRKVEARVEAAREAAAAESGEGPQRRRGVGARLGHAALRQLQVRVEGLRVRAHPELEQSPPLELFCARLALDEGPAEASDDSDGSQGVPSVPEEIRRHPATLDKVLELAGLSVQLRALPGGSGADAVAVAARRWDAAGPCALRERLAEHQRALERAPGGSEAWAAMQRELQEVKAQLQACPGERVPLLGPLSLEARLWHSLAGGLLWLCTQLHIPSGTAAVNLNPAVVHRLSEGAAWCSAALLAPPKLPSRVVAESPRSEEPPSGPKYVELCSKRIRGDIDSDDEVVLLEIEDLAPIDWLVRWQLRREEHLGFEAAQAAPPKRAGLVGWLRNRLSRGAAEEDGAEGDGEVARMMRPTPSTTDEDADSDTLDDLGLQEVEEPRRVEVRCMIPTCTIVACCLGIAGERRAGVLRLEGGVECRAAFSTATAGSIAMLSQAAWDADVQANLSSVAVRLDEEPLMLLQQGSHGDASPRSAGAAAEDDDGEFFDVLSDEEEMAAESVPSPARNSRDFAEVAAMRLALRCACRGGAAGSKSSTAAGDADGVVPTYAVRVRLTQEPFRFILAPQSLHNALDIVVTVVRSVISARARTRPAALPQSAAFNASADSASFSPARRVRPVAGASGEGDSPSWLALDLDLDVAAPVLRWGLLPQGHVTLALGRLLFRTCGVSPPPRQLTAAERCCWRTFACYCQLTETSAQVQAEDGGEWQVYDPSTICLRAWREADCNGWQISVKTEEVRWTMSPRVLQAAGQLPLSLDYAVSPLRSVLTDVWSGQSQAVDGAGAGAGSDARAADAAGAPGSRRRGGGAEGAGDAAPELALPAARAAPLRLRVSVCLSRAVLVCGPPGTPLASLAFAGAAAEYTASAGRLDVLAQVANFEIAHDSAPLVSCASGASVRVQNADRHLGVSGDSALIEVRWRESCVRKVVAIVMDSWECLGNGHAGAQGLLPVEDNAGMFAKLWGRYVIKPIQVRVQKKVADRLAQLLPGQAPRADEAPPQRELGEAEAAAQPGPQRQPGGPCEPPSATDAGDEAADAATSGAEGAGGVGGVEALPSPRGEISVEVNLKYEGVTASFVGGEGEGNVAASTVDVAVTGAEFGFRGHRSGDTAAIVSLQTTELSLLGRRLLAPRRASKLLEVEIIRLAGGQHATFWTASWAQVCILFRQRDYDFLSAFLRTAVFDALPSRRRPPAQSQGSRAPAAKGSPPSPEPEACPVAPEVVAERTPPSARFRLDIGAPLVFLPTDGSVLLPPRVVEQEDCIERGSNGQLEVIDASAGEPGFRPEPGEGVLVFDFGHVAASGGGEGAVPGQVGLQLRGAHVLGATALLDRPGAVQEILCPLTWNAVLKTGTGPIEFHATSTTDVLAATSPAAGASERQTAQGQSGNRSEDGSTVVQVAHRLKLTRARLTLILDVLAENICYSGRSARRAQAEAQPAAPERASSVDSVGGRRGEGERRVGRGFKFSWTWPGELAFDIAFTDSAPIAQLRLRSGKFSIDNSSLGSKYEVVCSGLAAQDLRKKSRNAVKQLLEIDCHTPGEVGFGVYVNFAADADGSTLVQVNRPIMHVLPQLVMDLICAGLSAWQHCSFRNDRAQPAADPPAAPTTPAGALAGAAALQRHKSSSSSLGSMESGAGSSAPRRGTRVQVNLSDGVFRIAERWDDPAEHFEFAGSLIIAILAHAEGIRIERFDLVGGALRLRSKRRAPTTLCPCLEWIVRGEQRRTDDGMRMKRQTNYDLRSVILPPYAIRMSAKDHQAMVRSLMELISLDAETSEPSEETRSRDPLALKLVENRMTLTAEVAIQGAEVQILGEEGGHEWPGLKANARCPLFEVAVQTRQGYAPTINLFTKTLEIDLWAHNHRLGVWEPVLPPCSWRLSYHRQRKPDGAPRELIVRGDVSATSPVRLIVSGPFVQLASRVFKDSAGEVRYGNLLAGLNISGVSCHIAVDDGEQCLLAAESRTQSLDELLKGSGRLGQGGQPRLRLTLAEHPEDEPCYVPLGREESIMWETKSVGLLICRLIVPRPPQHLLVISSTVCVWNRAPTDLEVRFLAPEGSGAELAPKRTRGAFRSVDARVLTGTQDTNGGGDVGAEAASAHAEETASAVPGCGDDGALRLRAGHMFSVPPEAQLRAGQAVMQLRPAPDTSGGILYQWSDPFFSVPTGTSDGGAVSVSSAPPEGLKDMPRHWLYMRACCSPSAEGWCVVDVQAPFTIVNACPCDLFCRLNPFVMRTSLGKDRDRFAADPGTAWELCVGDGRGGEVRVPQGGQAEILPLRLDADGCFHWTCNGRPGRTRAKRDTNCLIAVLDARRGEIVWHFFVAVMGPEVERDRAAPLRICSQSVLPAFDVVAEDLCVSFALRDTEGVMTAWSFPMQAVDLAHSSEEVIEVVHRGMYVQLNASRSGRELVIYSRWWFVNSTGLDVRLMQPGGPGKMHPVWCFSDDRIAFLPQVRNDTGDGVAFVELQGERPVEVRVPDVGGAQAVQLTPLHSCCLRTERVALPEAMRGVPCCVVSLLPALLLFNRLSAELEIGLRQVGCSNDSATWVSSGASGALWWASREEKVVQVAVRRRTSMECARTAWSDPFEIRESRIGAYPVALRTSLSSPFLLCLSIDQDAFVLSVTVTGRSSCHSVISRHPHITVEASMDGACDGSGAPFSFHVPHGERVFVAGRPPPPGGGGAGRLRLTLKSIDDPEDHAYLNVDLGRTGIFRARTVNNRPSALRMSTVVTVELRNRVAIVTLTAGVPSRGDDGDVPPEDLRTSHGMLRVDSLSIALLLDGRSHTSSSSFATPWAGAGPGPSMSTPTSTAATGAAARCRWEAFTISLAKVCLDVHQTPTRQRKVDFKIHDVQVDLQCPPRDVVLKSTTRPFLQMCYERDDVRTLDLHIKEMQLNFGDLEVSVTGEALEQVRQLRRSLMPGTVGLALREVVSRAHVPYHVNRREPLRASSKLAVSSLVISQAKVDVWCRLYLPDAHYVPKSLRETLQVVSLTNRLDVKGAQLKLPQQALFSQRSPGEGSLSTVLARVSDHYLPHVKACWRSLRQHSNILLGGFLSWHAWAPRQRREWKPMPPLCSVGSSGEVVLHEPAAGTAGSFAGASRRGRPPSGPEFRPLG